MKKSFVIALMTVVLLTSGCTFTSLGEASSSPYEADIVEIIEKAKGTDAESAVSEILSDKVVTEVEMLDRAQAQNTCMHQAGFPRYNADPLQGGIDYGTVDDAEIEQIYIEEKNCEKRTFALEIGSLYFAMVRNPLRISEHELMAACLVKTGVVPPSYSGNDYLESLEAHERKNEESSDVSHQDPAYAVPYIVDEERGKDAFRQCSQNPQKILYSDTKSN